MALVVSLGRGPEALALFKKLTAANPANIHWQNLKPGSGKPLFPHLRIYRQALEEFLMPDDLKNLEGKQLEFLMAVSPLYALQPWYGSGLYDLWLGKAHYRCLAPTLDTQTGVCPDRGEQPRGDSSW